MELNSSEVPEMQKLNKPMDRAQRANEENLLRELQSLKCQKVLTFCIVC